MNGPDVQYSRTRPRSAWPARPRAVLCDLDGTAIQSESFWVEMLNLALERVHPSASLTERDRSILQGGSVDEHLGYIWLRYPYFTLDELRLAYEAAVDAQFYSTELDELCGKLPVAEGFEDIRIYCKEFGVPLVLVTNGSQSKAVREVHIMAAQLGLTRSEDVCDFLVCSPDESRDWLRLFGVAAGKPHPWPYVEALKAANVNWSRRSQVIGVEDSEAGIRSLRATGVRAIGLSSGNISVDTAATTADRMVDELSELLDDCARS